MSDKLVRRAYGATPALDADSAWESFEKILNEADRERTYDTRSIAAFAVERLVPLLDPSRLVTLAERRVTRGGSVRIRWYEELGTPHFVHPGNTIMAWSAGSLMPRDYAIAHAVLLLDSLLDPRGTPPSNLVEERIPAALVRWHEERGTLPLRLATRIGGEAIETFLLRQDWRSDERLFPSLGRDVNR